MISTTNKFFLFGALLLLSFSCNNHKEQSKANPDVKSEVENNDSIRNLDIEVTENTVRIGKQTWMLRNLEVTSFRNGDPIYQVKQNPEWQKQSELKQAVFGYFGNDIERAKKLGNTYNWYAVNDKRGLAPEGWRIPSKEDWQQLIDYLGGNAVAGHKLKNIEGWGGDGNGDNKSGFAGLPGGFRGYDGISYSVGYMARWWTSTESGEYFAHGFDINYDAKSINPSTGYKQDGFSVRCIKE